MSVKGNLKTLVKQALKLGGCVSARSRILTYHSVGNREHEMNVTPEAFRRQMHWLKENAHVIPLAEAACGKAGVAITFDDGYRDNLANAAPVLASLELPATVFIVAGRLGKMLPHDSDPKTSTLMTWDEVRDLESMGVTIGAHSLTHPRLSALDDAQQHEEIVGCGQRIQHELRHFPESFAYPYGSSLDYDETSISLVREAGYDFAVSNRYGWNDPGANAWTLRRIWIDRTDSFEMFCAKVDGRLDRLRWLDSPLGIHARRTLNSLTG